MSWYELFCLRVKGRTGGHDHKDVITWDKLRKEIGDLFPIRNRLAHHPVTSKSILEVEIPDSPPLPGVAVDLFTRSWFESYVSDAERMRGQHDHIKPLLTPNLSIHRIEVEAIITKLEIFRSHVLSKYG